jgi:hypothetical protein
LWHPNAFPPPNALLEALQSRGLAWSATDRALTALVRLLAPPTDPSPSPGPIPTVLVLVEPSRLRRLDDVLDVITRYRPRTALWVFDLADPSRLRSMQALEIISKYAASEASNPAMSESSATRSIPTPATSPWRLHLVPATAEPPQGADLPRSATTLPPPSPSNERAPSRVSQQETSMLTSSLGQPGEGFRTVQL